MKIFTVGYESCDIEDFTQFLKSKKIQHVADLRKNPVSRKRGFSKRKLAEALAAKGISYTHHPALGVPSEWRKRAKAEEITRRKMFADYVRKVLPLAEGECLDILGLAGRNPLAVLCYEADATDCHRHYVVERLQKISKKRLNVTHLKPLEEMRARRGWVPRAS